MNFLFYTTVTLLLFVAVVLILLILIQKGRGGGLSSAFGGSGGSTAFGAKTGDVLTWATSIVFGVFVVLAVTLDLVVNAQYASKPAATAMTPTPVESAMPAAAVPPAVLAGPDRITQELARLQHSGSPATMPAGFPSTMPATLPSVARPGMSVKPLAVPTTLPAPAIGLVPAGPPTTRPR